MTRHLAAANCLFLTTGTAEDLSLHTAASAREHRSIVLFATKFFWAVDDALFASDLCILYNCSTHLKPLKSHLCTAHTTAALISEMNLSYVYVLMNSKLF